MKKCQEYKNPILPCWWGGWKHFHCVVRRKRREHSSLDRIVKAKPRLVVQAYIFHYISWYNRVRQASGYTGLLHVWNSSIWETTEERNSNWRGEARWGKTFSVWFWQLDTPCVSSDFPLQCQFLPKHCSVLVLPEATVFNISKDVKETVYVISFTV